MQGFLMPVRSVAMVVSCLAMLGLQLDAQDKSTDASVPQELVPSGVSPSAPAVIELAIRQSAQVYSIKLDDLIQDVPVSLRVALINKTGRKLYDIRGVDASKCVVAKGLNGQQLSVDEKLEFTLSIRPDSKPLAQTLTVRVSEDADGEQINLCQIRVTGLVRPPVECESQVNLYRKGVDAPSELVAGPMKLSLRNNVPGMRIHVDEIQLFSEALVVKSAREVEAGLVLVEFGLAKEGVRIAEDVVYVLEVPYSLDTVKDTRFVYTKEVSFVANPSIRFSPRTLVFRPKDGAWHAFSVVHDRRGVTDGELGRLDFDLLYLDGESAEPKVIVSDVKSSVERMGATNHIFRLDLRLDFSAIDDAGRKESNYRIGVRDRDMNLGNDRPEKGTSNSVRYHFLPVVFERED